MFFELFKIVMKPVLDFVLGIIPGYEILLLLGISFSAAFAYSKLNFKNFWSPVRGDFGFVIIFGAILFLLFEAFLL